MNSTISKVLAAVIAFSLAITVSSASAAPAWDSPITAFEDDTVVFLIKGEGNTQSGIIETGDLLASVFEYNKSAGLPIQPEELTGLAILEVADFLDLDGGGIPNDIVFQPATKGFDFYSGIAPLPNGNGAPGSVGMVAFWLDGDPDLDIKSDTIVAGNPSCTTYGGCVAQATDGDSWMITGFGADPDNSWVSLNARTDTNDIDAAIPSVILGTFNFGLSVLFNNTGQTLTPNGISCFPFCGIGGDGMVDVLTSASINGGGENIVSSEWYATGDIDMTLRSEPINLAALGDRVWEDLNVNGIQDCEDSNGNGILGDVDPLDPANPAVSDQGPECGDRQNGGAGIAGLPVNLFQPDGNGDCTVDLGMQVVTGADGLYLFQNLLPGDYCVQFTLPEDDFCDVTVGDEIFSLGAPKFTLQNVVGTESTDSDAGMTSGFSDSVNLSPGETDLKVDAGVVCPAKIGDRVWQDDNEDGAQNVDEENVPDVLVKLYECTDGNAIVSDDKFVTDTLTDDSDSGMNYMFGGGPETLPPGEYFVQFVKPDGTLFTIPNDPDANDSVDSDCSRPNGTTSCVTLGSGDVDLTYDCGLIPPPPPSCDLTLDKQCRVEAPPVVSGDEKCDGKLQEFTVIWAGDDGIFVSGPDNDSNGAAVNNGQEVTFTGPFSDNDVFVNITGAVIGESKFHMSCSDKDMDGWSETNEAQLQVSARDCGKDQGDAKSNGDPDFINDWLLEGFVDNSGQVLDCNAGNNGGDTFTDSCTVPPQTFPSCDTLGKPANLVFEYTGGGCGASSNSQKDDECSITGGPVFGDVTIVAAGDKDFDKDIYTATPDMVSLNETFGLTNGSSDLKSNSFIRITDADGHTELNRIHTSCSQDLVVGDVYGSLKLVGFDGQTGGVDVTYQYTVTNNGDPLTDVSVVDNLLGTVGGPVDLGDGDIEIFTATASITGTTVNTATASGTIAGSTAECQASDEVVVEFPEPPVAPVSCSDIKDITAVSAVWNGAGPVDVMGANSGEMFLGVQPGNRITFLRAGSGNDIVLNVSGAADNGSSKFHVSCSDDDMNGTEDCGSDQGDGKGNDSSLINDWLFDGMTGEQGSFDCGLPNSGVVDAEEGTGPSGGNVTAAPSLDLNDDKKVKWELTNSGSADVFVKEVVITWPSEHGQLKKFKLEGDFAKDVFDSTSPTSVPDEKAFESDANKRKLKAGDSKNLEIEFTEDFPGHIQSDYTITVEFEDGQIVSFP